MERELLRKVQLKQLEIAKEIKRVCEENEIGYFLCYGTFLGAVRHKGFIPWDDDLDLGMLRADYEKFCRIAPTALKPEFCLQTWYTDPNYGLPFGKVMLRNTIYLESKKTTRLKQNGIYVDIFPFDFAPESAKQQDKLAKALLQIYRVKLMKSGYKPWMENDSIVWKKRIGYLFYQAKALFARQEDLSRAYDALAESIDYSSVLCGQCALPRLDCFQTEWFEHMTDYVFESEHFPGPVNYDAVLSAEYGDYMTLPPVEERENRHQIYRVEFDA